MNDAIIAVDAVQGKTQNKRLRILTNMRFHESPRWCAAVDSIYPDHGKATRPRSPLAEAWRLWRRCGAYDAVVTAGARESLLYGLLCLMTGRPSKQVMTEIFLDQRSGGFSRFIKDGLFKAIGRRALGGITNSRHEAKTQAAYFGWAPERAFFVPINANALPPDPTPQDGGYLLAAGRSGRDYQTLAKAMEGLGYPLVIVCGRGDVAGLHWDSRVTIHEDISHAAYVELLRNCAALIVPLQPTTRSTGQVVILEAMSLGKPVVATRTPGTVDYIAQRTTGLLVEVGDAVMLRGEIAELMANDAMRLRLGKAARIATNDEFSVDKHAQGKLAVIASLVGTA